MREIMRCETCGDVVDPEDHYILENSRSIPQLSCRRCAAYSVIYSNTERMFSLIAGHPFFIGTKRNWVIKFRCSFRYIDAGARIVPGWYYWGGLWDPFLVPFGVNGTVFWAFIGVRGVRWGYAIHLSFYLVRWSINGWYFGIWVLLRWNCCGEGWRLKASEAWTLQSSGFIKVIHQLDYPIHHGGKNDWVPQMDHINRGRKRGSRIPKRGLHWRDLWQRDLYCREFSGRMGSKDRRAGFEAHPWKPWEGKWNHGGASMVKDHEWLHGDVYEARKTYYYNRKRPVPWC